MEDGWHICALGVMSIVTKVGGHVTDAQPGGNTLERHFNDFGDHFYNAVIGVGSAGKGAAGSPIGTALNEFVHHYKPTLKGMATKTGRCIKGVVDATNYYLLADHEMGAEAKKHLKMARLAEKMAINVK
jgi:hypothetical protein